jgi:peroxiredoxin
MCYRPGRIIAMASKIALNACGRIDGLDTLDTDWINRFISAYAGPSMKRARSRSAIAHPGGTVAPVADGDASFMNLPRLLIIAAILGLFTTSTSGAADQEARHSVSDAMKQLRLIGPPSPTRAPAFMATLEDGSVFQLSSQRGKIVFINFWATWCLPCRTEMPMMEKLWRRHRDQPFAMLAVSIDSTPSAVSPFIAQHGLTFPIALDAGQALARAYGLRGLPMSVIVDPIGNVAALAIGPRDWDGPLADTLIEGLMR